MLLVMCAALMGVDGAALFVFCVRPLLRRRRRAGPTTPSGRSAGETTGASISMGIDAQLTAAEEELVWLRKKVYLSHHSHGANQRSLSAPERSSRSGGVLVGPAALEGAAPARSAGRDVGDDRQAQPDRAGPTPLGLPERPCIVPGWRGGVEPARLSVALLDGEHGDPSGPRPQPAVTRDSKGWRRHFPVNMSRAEQMARLAAAVTIAALTALVLPGAAGGGWGMALVVAGWLAVTDLAVSGLTGHCPLHRLVRLPWDPKANG